MLPRGLFKTNPDDFVVEEIPLYSPSGEGEHVYVRFTKRALTTDEAVRAISSSVRASSRDAGVAGLKDKWGVTTQTISLALPRSVRTSSDSTTSDPFIEFADRIRSLQLPNISIQDVSRHGNKLKTGHLAGNRFAIRVRGIERKYVAEVVEALERIGRNGLPNAFGAQRFGREKNNAAQARDWLSGRTPGPRDPKTKRFLWSALQSEAFNAVLQARVDDGTWATPLEGDLIKRRSSGGMYICTDAQLDKEAAESGELSPTGPMFGVKMREPSGAPLELEKRIFCQVFPPDFDLASVKTLGEGARRPLRMSIDEMRVEIEDPSTSSGEPFNSTVNLSGNSAGEQEQNIRVHFVLPKGSYATTVLGAAIDLVEPTRHD